MLDHLLQGLVVVDDEQGVPPGQGLGQFRQNWGFSVYRTDYHGPSSDQQWQTLIEKIQSQVKDEIMRVSNADGASSDEGTEAQQLLSLFHLDLHSDSETLKECSMEQVRQLHKEEILRRSGAPNHGAAALGRGNFLLVDGEVLAEVAAGHEFLLKCVQANYEPADYVPKNSRVQQRYFGWMKMTTRSVFDLWEKLVMFGSLESIAPQTIGGQQVVVWDGDCSM